MTRIFYLITLVTENERYREVVQSGSLGTTLAKLLNDAELRDEVNQEDLAKWVSELNEVTEAHEELIMSQDPDFLVFIETVEETYYEGSDIDDWDFYYNLRDMEEEEDLNEDAYHSDTYE